jgi:hypothetical protein
MNNTHQAELVATVERIAIELDKASEDVALLQRLKAAEANAKRLVVELAEAQDALAEAAAADVIANRDAALAHFQDIRITDESADPAASILHRAYRITVTQLAYNGYENLPQTYTYQGFAGLPSDALTYLMLRHPERVPEQIRELAPDDVWQAYNIYTIGLRRGYMTGPST